MINIALPVGLFLAQNGKYSEPIVTDRPDFTESAVTVPLKSLQLEMGLTHEWAGDDRTLGFPEALLRYGIAPKWEARLGLPNRVLLDSPGGREAGWGDTYAGFKVQLGPVGAYDVAIIGAAFLPTGNPGFNAGAIEPEIKFCVGRDLSPTEGISGMIYTSWPDANRRGTQLQLTLSYGREIGPNMGMFLEYAGTFAPRQDAEHLLHTGVAFRVGENAQWDIHFGISQSRRFLAGGYAIRF